MLDIKRIRQNPEALFASLSKRGINADISELMQKDDARRKLLARAEAVKNERNALSRQLGMAKKKKASEKEIEQYMLQLRAFSSEVETLDRQIAETDDEIYAMLSALPNYPHFSVPSRSCSEEAIVCMISHDEPKGRLWEPKSAYELCRDLHLCFSQPANGDTQVQHRVCRNMGARLRRAIINYFLNFFSEAGFDEIHSACTSSIADLYRDTILPLAALPARYCTCFPDKCLTGNEASAGCNGIELFTITHPEDSYHELDQLAELTSRALQALHLPWRVVISYAEGLEFAAAKTYSIEVWMPSLKRYMGVGTLSNCEDYLARDLGIRSKESGGGKPQLVHTVGGYAIDPDRMMDSILENDQNEDGTVDIPSVLLPYTGTNIISKSNIKGGCHHV